MDWLLDLTSNIIANIIFWLGLGLIFRYLVFTKTQKKFLKFFGLESKKKLVVYLSNLWLPSSTQKPWSSVISGHEFRVTKTINNLFGSAPFTFPEMIRGLVDTFWITKNLDVSVEVSPMGGCYDLSCNAIVVGASTKNCVRRYFLSKNMVHINIAGEQTDTPQDKDVLNNPLKPYFVIRKGKQAGEIKERAGEFNPAVIEKIIDPEDHTVIFMCIGLRGDTSWAATEYLARHWHDLYEKFGEKKFARCMWFPLTEKPMDIFIEPHHIEDFTIG